MTETTTLMKSHSSVRRFKEQEIPQADLTEILTAAQMASSWKKLPILFCDCCKKPRKERRLV